MLCFGRKRARDKFIDFPTKFELNDISGRYQFNVNILVSN